MNAQDSLLAPQFPKHVPPTFKTVTAKRFNVCLADECDREPIAQLRHAIYAEEIGQHPPNPQRQLRDLDENRNLYLVAKLGTRLCGFISITPPNCGPYSFEKYFPADVLPFRPDSDCYEIRLLSVQKEFRGSDAATLLMYAAFRWIQAHGGKNIVAIGREEILELYLRLGLEPVGPSVKAGAVLYHLLASSVQTIGERIDSMPLVKNRLRTRHAWHLSVEFDQPATCFHGGQFFTAVGPSFEHLERSQTIINADVLDAWFDPSPKVVSALQQFLPWLSKTSPPTSCEGLIETLAQCRKLSPANLLPGNGSSDLIFRALRHWLNPGSRVLLMDPTYGEYAHVIEKVIGCRADRFELKAEDDYEINCQALSAALQRGYDLVVLVNPNSPTGKYLPEERLKALLRSVPRKTRVWLDETYLEYVPGGVSLESLAAQSENVVVCKSMSKVYALSGLRVAYLCAKAHQLETLRAITPPWVVSLPAQVAAVYALQDPDYYRVCYAETHRLRLALATFLRHLGWKVIDGCANFLLCHLPGHGPDAATLVKACQRHGLFLRDASLMGTRLGKNMVRLAVKDAHTQSRMCGIIEQSYREHV